MKSLKPSRGYEYMAWLQHFNYREFETPLSVRGELRLSEVYKHVDTTLHEMQKTVTALPISSSKENGVAL